MRNVTILYGPKGGKTEGVALLFKELLPEAQLLSVDQVTSETFETNEFFICGMPTVGKDTWEFEINNECSVFINLLKNTDLTGKTFACFGLGDHISYANHFVDSLGDLVDIIENKGGTTVGEISIEGYEFNESKACKDGMFVGLPLDEDFESEKTKQRVVTWLELLPIR